MSTDIPSNLLSGAINEVYKVLSGDEAGWDSQTFNEYIASIDPARGLQQLRSITKGWVSAPTKLAAYVRTSSRTSAVEVDYARGLAAATVFVDIYVPASLAGKLTEYHDAILYFLSQWDFGVATLGYETEIHTTNEGDTANYVTIEIDFLVKVLIDGEDDARSADD